MRFADVIERTERRPVLDGGNIDDAALLAAVSRVLLEQLAWHERQGALCLSSGERATVHSDKVDYQAGWRMHSASAARIRAALAKIGVEA